MAIVSYGIRIHDAIHMKKLSARWLLHLLFLTNNSKMLMMANLDHLRFQLVFTPPILLTCLRIIFLASKHEKIVKVKRHWSRKEIIAEDRGILNPLRWSKNTFFYFHFAKFLYVQRLGFSWLLTSKRCFAILDHSMLTSSKGTIG